MLTVSATDLPPQDSAADTVAVGFFEDEAIGHGLQHLVAAGEAKAELRKVCVWHADGKRWLAVGLGPRDRFDVEAGRVAAGVALARGRDLGTRSLFWALPEGAAVGGVVEGSVLAAYEVGAYKSDRSDPALTEVLVAGDVAAVEEARVLAEAVNVARRLQDAPPNLMTPVALAAHARTLAAELSLEIDVLGRAQLEAARMGAFAGVARGAAEEPQLITLRYRGGGSGPVLGLIGKAVMFDTGGISIKGANKMADMKFDMSGGAAVLGAIEAIARLGLPVDVLAVVGATMNDIGARAYKPGDILTARNGTTIEVLNTDAEGRLVLADCLTHAIEQGAERLIDVATLTGAILSALGKVYGGLFANDDPWADAVLAAGAAAGEPFWRMPLDERYAALLKGTYADVVNVNEARLAGSSVAASFLHRFAGDTPWAHLDIAGTAWDREQPYAPKGGCGFATRTLVEAARALA